MCAGGCVGVLAHIKSRFSESVYRHKSTLAESSAVSLSARDFYAPRLVRPFELYWSVARAGPNMNDADAFLQAIREDPENDTPRLIFADWLEERGDPRGEFIRVQCALAHCPEDNPGPEFPAWKARESELRTTHEREWTRP